MEAVTISLQPPSHLTLWSNVLHDQKVHHFVFFLIFDVKKII
jgi:hypothetical protein